MPVAEGQEPEEFRSYDPADYTPSDEKDQPQTSGALYDEEGRRLPSFDMRYANDFEGLLYLGALVKEFEWLGHRFVIRTLRSDELLAVPVLIKPWMGGIGEGKAYAIAMAALAVVSVDDQELPIPLGDGRGEYAWAYQRFNYAKANWFQFTIDKVYSEYMALEAKAQAVIEAMEKASGPAASTGGSNATSAGPSDEVS